MRLFDVWLNWLFAKICQEISSLGVFFQEMSQFVIFSTQLLFILFAINGLQELSGNLLDSGFIARMTIYCLKQFTVRKTPHNTILALMIAILLMYRL